MTAATPQSSPHAGTATRANWPGWINLVIAALLMLATLPGRTQGLGLITEPMLHDLNLSHIVFARINLWATLLGAVCCLPIGWLLDRFGIRWIAAATTALLAWTVWRMSGHTEGVGNLFLLILLTRALGQSALSVISITTVGKSFGRGAGLPMGVYAVLLSVLFAAAFVMTGQIVAGPGWRIAWRDVAVGLLLVVPITLFGLRSAGWASHRSQPELSSESREGLPLASALKTPAFWIFAGATALFGLVSSGLGLFNEAVLAERGFDQKTYHTFLAVTTLIALIGQFGCGWLSLRWPMQRLLGLAMFLYGFGIITIPFIRTAAQLWVGATAFGLAGGMITVLFFAVWGNTFGQAQLGRIQGAAQMLTVFASAAGPLLFAKCSEATGSYSTILIILAPLVFILGVASWQARLPKWRNSGLETAGIPA